jgi:hypothetical protein
MPGNTSRPNLTSRATRDIICKAAKYAAAGLGVDRRHQHHPAEEGSPLAYSPGCITGTATGTVTIT